MKTSLLGYIPDDLSLVALRDVVDLADGDILLGDVVPKRGGVECSYRPVVVADFAASAENGDVGWADLEVEVVEEMQRVAIVFDFTEPVWFRRDGLLADGCVHLHLHAARSGGAGLTCGLDGDSEFEPCSGEDLPGLGEVAVVADVEDPCHHLRRGPAQGAKFPEVISQGVGDVKDESQPAGVISCTFIDSLETISGVLNVCGDCLSITFLSNVINFHGKSFQQNKVFFQGIKK